MTETPGSPTVPEPPRKLWTRAECEKPELSGLLEQEHFELVEVSLMNVGWSRDCRKRRSGIHHPSITRTKGTNP
jgi:hypothetical protein